MGTSSWSQRNIRRIKKAAAEQLDVTHPLDPRIPGITNTSFTGPLLREHGPNGAEMVRSVNAVIVSPGRLDRTPCGTGTSARLALLHARGQLRSLPTTNWSLTQPTPSQKDSSLGNRGKLSTDMTNGPITDWSNLAGAHVEIRQQGAAICTGTVDAVTEDGSILWVYAEPYGRRLFEKAEYFEAWAAEERLGFHYRMAMGWTRPVPGQ